MKRALLALLLALSAPLANAATPTQAATDAQVDRLLEVMRARETVESMMPRLETSQLQMMEQLTAGRALTAAEHALFERIAARNAATIREMLTWERLVPTYRDIYRQTFDTEDMQAMIDFYGSPSGQRVLDRMPQLMQHTMDAMQTLLAPVMQQMQQDAIAEVEASLADIEPE